MPNRHIAGIPAFFGMGISAHRKLVRRFAPTVLSVNTAIDVSRRTTINRHMVNDSLTSSRQPDGAMDVIFRDKYSTPLSRCPEEALRDYATAWRFANYPEGVIGDCDPSHADWRYEQAFDLSAVKDLLSDWKQWFDVEIAIEEAAGIGCGYRAMLSEDIKEEIVVLVRDGKGYIWDGWHPVAAALLSGRTTLKAIVGTPRPTPISSRRRTGGAD